MTGPKFENTVSWNLLLGVIMAVASVGASWGLFAGRISNLEALVSAQAVEVSGQEVRLRSIETREAATAERITAIYATVQRIERLIENGGAK